MAELEEGMEDQAEVDATDETLGNVMHFIAYTANEDQN